MQKPRFIFQFLNASLICLLPSLILFGKFSVGLITAMVSPLICTAIFPMCRSDRRLWTYIWTAEAMAIPNLVLMEKAVVLLSPFVSFTGAAIVLRAVILFLLFFVEELLYSVVVRLIWERAAEPTDFEPQEEENHAV